MTMSVQIKSELSKKLMNEAVLFVTYIFRHPLRQNNLPVSKENSRSVH